jgi:hypothetical protein
LMSGLISFVLSVTVAVPLVSAVHSTLSVLIILRPRITYQLWIELRPLLLRPYEKICRVMIHTIVANFAV